MSSLFPSSHRARAGLALALAAATLTLSPAALSPATAATARPARTATASTECANAQAALAQARQQRRAAHAALVTARIALHRARAGHHPVKAARIQKRVTRLVARNHTLAGVVATRSSRMSYACAAPTSTARAVGTGKGLALLALADGLPVSLIGVDQLTALLNTLLPGVTSQLSAEQLTALLGGFNAVGGGVDPTDALNVLSGEFSPADIASILAGTASPELLTNLAEELLGELSGLAGGSDLPGSVDPTDLLNTFAGVFGALNPTQFGDLLVLLTRATGNANSTFSMDQLTSLVGGLAPGALDAFSPDQLTTMLGVLNGHVVSESVLSNILGGQFTTQQLSSVMGGTAGSDLTGQVFSQVMAQFATGGDGGLALPSGLDSTQLADLVSTMTSLVTGLLGGGGGLLGGICGILPLPGLC